MELRIRADGRSRAACPIVTRCTADNIPAALACGSDIIAVQRDGDMLAAVIAVRRPHADTVFSPTDAQTAGGAVNLQDNGSEIAVTVGGMPFTTYRYADVPARPYFWPVLAPGGIPVTRAWPMRDDVAGETHDHRHHRSMYFAFGDVNGVDNWSEEPGHGYTIHRSVDELVSGPVFGRFRTTSDWTDASGGKLLTQKVAVTFWNTVGETQRMLDVDLRLRATEGDVLFGDTKEGGMLTVRVATPMDVPNGGRIENSYGGINERETWGYAAHWCDYSGVVSGARVGIAVLDHPLSCRYPTYWHVRDYGLMGANPFALKAYTNGMKDGSYLLRSGEEMRFVYRVIVHLGDACEAGVRRQYLDFAAPPSVEVR